MRNINVFLISLVLLNCVTAFSFAGEVLSSVKSPDGRIKVELSKTMQDSLCYRVFYDNKQVIDESKLGVKFLYAEFSTKMAFVSSSEKEVNESYMLPSGKTRLYVDHYNELVSEFSRIGNKISIVFRVSNDGFAFRYVVNEASGGISTSPFQNEYSEIRVASFENSWAQPYRLDYSWYYSPRNWVESLQQESFCAPILVKSADTWFLLTESANYGTFSTSMLVANEEVGSYSFKSSTSVKPIFPLEMPWRTVLMGELTTIMKSTMVENLNPPTSLTDISWIVPGRSSWDWGGEDANNSVGYDIACKYIDLAHEMGWEYFTLDDGWDRGGYDLQTVVDYANDKDVKIILWSHQNRFKNDRAQINSILKEWKEIGIAGLKVDFWESDDQDMMRKYDTLLEEAGDLQLVINLHGSTKPSGTRRKWPHLLTSEAVFGGEMYLFNSESTTAAHNVNLTMTRNVIGPMDYTPGDFGNKHGQVKQLTTWAHQLALLTAYESGIQCYIDCPQNYRYHIAQSLLERLPAAWDEIYPIEAKPDSFATIARRSNDDWYVAALCNESRTLQLSLSFLEEGKTYNAYVYKDGDCKSEIEFDYIPNLSKSSELTIPMLEMGGATIHFSTSRNFPKPKVQKYEAESEVNVYPRKEDDPSKLCSGNKYVSYVGSGQSLTFNNVTVDEEGEYAMTIYYMTQVNRNAYLKVNGGSSDYHAFESTGGWYGKNLGFITIPIFLNKGQNTIEFGNMNDYAPNFDRITIKSLVDDDLVSSLSEHLFEATIAIRVVEGGIFVSSAEAGLFSLFSSSGKLIRQEKIDPNENYIKINEPAGVYIANVNSNGESYSTKFIIQ